MRNTGVAGHVGIGTRAPAERTLLKELAAERRRFGYRRLREMVRRLGVVMSRSEHLSLSSACAELHARSIT